MLFATLPQNALPRGATIEWQVTAHTGRVPPPILLPSLDSVAITATKDGMTATTMIKKRPAQTLTMYASPDRTLSFQAVAGQGSVEVVHTVTRSEGAKSEFGVLTLRTLAQDCVEEEAKTGLETSLTMMIEQAYAVQVFYRIQPTKVLRHLNISEVSFAIEGCLRLARSGAESALLSIAHSSP